MSCNCSYNDECLNVVYCGHILIILVILLIVGHIDHSAGVMRVITWNKSSRGMTNGENGKDEFDSEEYETHATVLDKLLAWEKKLYDEVKVHFKSWVYLLSLFKFIWPVTCHGNLYCFLDKHVSL